MRRLGYTPLEMGNIRGVWERIQFPSTDHWSRTVDIPQRRGRSGEWGASYYSDHLIEISICNADFFVLVWEIIEIVILLTPNIFLSWNEYTRNKSSWLSPISSSSTADYHFQSSRWWRASWSPPPLPSHSKSKPLTSDLLKRIEIENWNLLLSGS